MKRKAADGVDGLNEAHAKKSRTDNPVYEFEAHDNQSDEESQDEDATSTLPASNTPLTPLSPARKWPSDVKKIKCTYPDCAKTFNRPARLVAHLRSHTNERPYKCTFPDCGKDYIEEKHLRQHIKGSHTSEREYTCTQPGCGKSFMTATRLRRHQGVHEGQERFRCRDFPPCNQTFRKHQTLQRHIRSEHLQVAAFPCNHRDCPSGAVCGEGFDTAPALKRHQEREHGEIRFWCDECGNQAGDDGQPKRVGFTTVGLLQAHMREVHVECMFCGLACNGKAELEEHIETQHANQNQDKRERIACTWPGCTKMFTRKSNLNVHIRSVHEGVQFVCGEVDLNETHDLSSWANTEGCGQGFVTKANLENHVRYVHLKLDRPRQVQQPADLEDWEEDGKEDPMSLVEEFVGAGQKSRRTLPCTFPGCRLKFTHNGELEAHIQSEHIIEQALLENAQDPADPMWPAPSTYFDDTMDGLPGVEEEHPFWIGADTGLGTSNAALDEEWLRDEAEMRQLVGPNELDGLIDPALGEPQ
ncbi:hypothetical protein F4779DRAFT_590351 [Xylariaceae sp. FL0662B]|nr:hypothetical protein F4779DRAFT_590351 [Xylariaceae sp. FL0662B]